MKKIILTLSLIGLLFSLNSCKDQFAGMNQNPTKVTQPDVTFLLASAIQQMNSARYLIWFYDARAYMLPWVEATVSLGGNGSRMNLFDSHSSRKSHWYTMMGPLFEARHYINDVYEGRKKASFQKISAITYAIQIYMGLMVTDVYGPLPYTQAMQALYTDPPKITPKYDTQKTLLNTWLKQLNSALKTIESSPKYKGSPVKQISLSSEDFIYGGNFRQWGKFINTLKLRIAVRLLAKNKQKALKIAQTVVSDKIGPITSNADNFVWSGSQNSTGPIRTPDHNYGIGVGSRQLINLLRTNQDPRLRFLFQKNDFNSMVIQGLYDAGKAKAIPPYIQKFIKNKTVNGKLIFTGWKAPSAPWVRYFGAPVAPDSTKSGSVAHDYFNFGNYLKLENKVYQPTSLFNIQLLGTRMDYTYPDVPGVTNINDKDVPFHYILASAAETNLYLAELKVLGANLPKSAEYYFKKGVSQSVKKFNHLADINAIVYYNKPYDTQYGVAVKLKTGEIQHLLSQPAYTLTGSSRSEKLDKIYIQEYINFLLSPTQLYVTSRRSGIPKFNGKYFPREPLWNAGTKLAIPRRFPIPAPTKSSSNYQNIIEGYKKAGFSYGSTVTPQVLHDQRVWYDKSAPDWGKGTNY